MRIAVIGGGAAGLVAAGAALGNGSEVVILERNEKLGKKLYITGKGRCNLTNADELNDFIAKIVTNPAFLRSSFSLFFNDDIIELLNSRGIATKLERGNRVFPQSDKASDVIKGLTDYCKGATIMLDTRVQSVEACESGFYVHTQTQRLFFDRVIIATGGITYKATGSSGDGYGFARKLGHTVSPLHGVLCGLECDSDSALSGLTLKNVNVTLVQGKQKRQEFGELLFTHKGVSGPTVLTLSSYYHLNEAQQIVIDLKPALTQQVLDERMQRDIKSQPNKAIATIMSGLLPQKLINEVLKKAEVQGYIKGNALTQKQRLSLVNTLKSLTYQITAKENDDCAVITRGGVSCKQINPKTMQSKLVEGLYFAGEIIDVDALTGGYNLQIAFSTGYAAGIAASAKE